MRKGIRAKHMLAWRDGAHRLLENGELVIEDGAITFVGPRYEGTVDEWLDAGAKIVTPGFINLHTHPISTPLNRSFREEQPANTKYWGLPFWIRIYELLDGTAEHEVIYTYALWELLRSGSTTAVLMTMAYPEIMADLVGKTGLRAYISPSYREASWLLEGQDRYMWDMERGQRHLEKSLVFVANYHGKAAGRVQALLGPEQVDTCSPSLLKETARLAEQMDLPVATHASQSKAEYEYILQKHGMTPVEFLHSNGLLSPRVIIAHCMNISGHSSVGGDPGRDLSLLARTGATVAHSPTIYARTGTILESLARYRGAGVNVGIGTDVAPQDMLAEMRTAMMCARIADRSLKSCTAGDIFDHATINGAKALRRSDIGRIAPGCAADLLFFDLDRLDLLPVWDPVQTLVYYATGQHIDTVMVGGEIVVSSGRALTIDEEALKKEIQRVAKNVWARVPRIADGRTARDLIPPVIPEW
jgi:cytosine/adenosine deaminase-related metal-dependent hydrolase